MKKVLLAAAAIGLSAGIALSSAGSALARPSSHDWGANDWTGFYIGAHAGYGWGKASPGLSCDGLKLFLLVVDPGNSPDCGTLMSSEGEAFIGAGSGPEYLTDNGFNHLKGWLAGAQLGYNQQWGNWVFGAELDGSLSSITATRHSLFETNHFGGPYEDEGKLDLDWMTTATLKAGYAAGRWMMYADGGLAIGGLHSTTSFNFDDTTTAMGWTVGVGAETKLSRSSSLFVKYNYIDFRNAIFLGSALSFFPEKQGYNLAINVVETGINFRWK